MGTLNTYWEMAQLAQASYIDLTSVANDLVVADFVRSDPQKFYKFSEAQANRLIGDAAFTVADRTANLNDAVGFSATLFKDNRSQQYTLALRGTENVPLTNIDWSTSVARISVLGVATEQIVAM